MLLDEILQLVIAGGTITCVSAAIIALSIEGRDSYGRFAALAALCTTVFQLYAYLSIAGILADPPFLNYLFNAPLYAIGPAVHLLVFSSVSKAFGPTRGFRFLPSVLILIGLPIAHYTGLYDFDHHPLAFFRGRDADIMDFIFAGSFVYNLYFYWQIGYKGRMVTTIRGLRNEKSAYIFIAIFLLGANVGVFTILAFPLRNEYLLYWACFFTSLLAVGGVLLHNIYPQLFEQFEVALEQNTYKNSKLGDIDVGRINRQITGLMENDRLYTDDDLSLGGLARMLKIKPYQLTEFLNVHKNTNFSRFINAYRIQEAGRLLSSGDKVSIIDTAHRVGFNNKATFNLAFRKIMGCTPSQYMQQHLKVNGRR